MFLEAKIVRKFQKSISSLPCLYHAVAACWPLYLLLICTVMIKWMWVWRSFIIIVALIKNVLCRTVIHRTWKFTLNLELWSATLWVQVFESCFLPCGSHGQEWKKPCHSWLLSWDPCRRFVLIRRCGKKGESPHRGEKAIEEDRVEQSLQLDHRHWSL